MKGGRNVTWSLMTMEVKLQEHGARWLRFRSQLTVQLWSSEFSFLLPLTHRRGNYSCLTGIWGKLKETGNVKA